MRIDEIVIDYSKQSMDRIVDPVLTNQIMKIYDITAKSTNDFTVLSYENYPPEFVSDILDELYELSIQVKNLSYNSQLPEIVQFIIDYFENS